ncbi:MAG TPA: CRTAC1 family protein [Ilumatobacteraceae bacterium]|nr:CRTAC1 family protein [Ilumatobacteraceae bacterium]
MPDEPALAANDGVRHTRRRRSRWTLVGVVAVATVGTGIALGVAAWRSDRSDSTAGEPPRFVDETAGSGIDHTYDGEFEFFVGGGVAAFDCDDDGRAELFLAGGTEPAALYRNQSPVGGALRFARQLSPVTDLTAVTGAFPLDIDSDGLVDLAVLRRGGNVVLRGRGDCRFEEATELLGVDGGDAWTVAFSATWEGSNVLPTMAFGNYLLPDRTGCDDSQLVRPTTAGDGYASPIALSPGYCALSILFSDWARSGQRDLRVSNDRHYYREGEEQLWEIAPGAAPREYTEADGWRPLQVWGMGIASQDLTGDGYPEVFLTSQGDNKLQMLDDGATQPAYGDIALERGVTAQRPFVGGDVLPSTAWHPEFDDVNNDGFIDLFVSKGNVDAQTGNATRDPSNLLIGQSDGTFVEGAEEAGIVGFERARGAALVDLNLDGMLDLVVVNRRVRATVWRNVGNGDAEQPEPMGHWIAVRLRQPAPNVDAVGSWVEVRVGERTVVREITVGGGHAGGQIGWLHAGVGEADRAEVRVQWPDGETGPWMTVGADQFVTIERGTAEAIPWQPSPS